MIIWIFVKVDDEFVVWIWLLDLGMGFILDGFVDKFYVWNMGSDIVMLIMMVDMCLVDSEVFVIIIVVICVLVIYFVYFF